MPKESRKFHFDTAEHLNAVCASAADLNMFILTIGVHCAERLEENKIIFRKTTTTKQ